MKWRACPRAGSGGYSLGESRGQVHPPTLEMFEPPGHPVLHTEVWWRAAAGKAERMGWRNTLGRGSLAYSGHLEGIHPGRNLGLLLSSHSVVSDFL